MAGRDIFILVDALGWRLAARHAFLADLLPFRGPLRTTLGYSAAAIPTLLTGLEPARHGHWNLLAYAPERSPFAPLRHVPAPLLAALDHRAGRRLFTLAGRHGLGLGLGFECCVAPRLLALFAWGGGGDWFAPGGLAPARSIFDEWRAAGLDPEIFHYRQAGDEELIRRAAAAYRGGAQPIFLYLAELDGALHRRGTKAEAVAPLLARYELWLRPWLQQASIEGARIALFSDHGMAEVRGKCDVAAHVAALGLRQPRDYLAVYDSTMARFWFFHPAARQQVTAALGAMAGGRWLSDEELRREGVYFADRRFGELIYLLAPGWLIARGNFNGGAWQPVGMHGYHPDDADSDAVYASNRAPTRALVRLADVPEEMRRCAPRAPRAAGMARRPLNVLYVSRARARGGAEEHWLGLLAGLDRARFRPHLACPAALLALLGEAIPHDVPRVALAGGGPRDVWRLAAALRRWRIDILHSHLFHASRLASPLGRALGVPVIVETPHVREAWRRGWKSSFALDRLVGASVDAYIAVSQANAHYLRETKRLLDRKIVVIENGVEVARFAGPPAARRTGAPRLLTVGRLEEQKGHAVLLEALPAVRRQYPRARLLCLGEGSARAALVARARALGVSPSVTFLGYRAPIEPWLALADIVVLASWYEGLPLAALEALAAGRPVVATAVDGTCEAVIHERTGLTVPPGDAAALAAAILRLLAAPAWAEQLGREGRRWVRARFDRRRQLERTQALYLDLWLPAPAAATAALAAGAA